MTDEEKTEKATPRRESEARDRGQVARSQDLSMAVLMLAAVSMLTVSGPRLADLMLSAMRELLSLPPPAGFDVGEAAGLLRGLALRAGAVVLPIAAVVAFMALVAGVLQVGWRLTPKALEFKPERFNPVMGLRKLINLQGLVRCAFAAGKLLLLGLILWFSCRGRLGELANLSHVELPIAAGIMLDAVMRLFWVIALVLLVLGIGDFIFQKWKHGRDLRMSKQEIKDEMKSLEGDPLIRSRIKQAQRRLARLRMMQEVPRANVVITNPTHAAVALRYDQEVMSAPVVVAKGWDDVARRIRETAAAHGVPVYEEPPLARALCAAVEVGDEVPVRFYQAVAAVLAHVYRLAGPVPAGGR